MPVSQSSIWSTKPPRPTVLVGGAIPPPPASTPCVRVVCDRHHEALGAWLAVGREARRRLGLTPRAAETGRGVGPSESLRGARERDPLGDVIADLNTLHAQRPVVVIFDRIDAADSVTLDALTRALSSDGWLRPVVMVSMMALDERVRPLVERLEAAGGQVIATQTSSPPRFVLPGALPPEARRVMRAAAVIGSAFEVELLADMVGVDPIAALEALQSAADAGVHFDDEGDGHLRMHPDLAATLRADTLPSLARAWHRRLAEHLHPANPDAADDSSDSADPVDAFIEFVELEVVDELPPDLARPQWSNGTDAVDRAAEHLIAADEIPAAVNRLLVAMDEALALGASDQALALADQARSHLDHLPPSARTRRQRVALLTAVAQAQHHAVGPRNALTVARATADAAWRLMRGDDPPRLRAALDTLRARILYDQGSPAALQEALAVLTACSRWLDAHNAPREAARLFNDQAAVWVRLGDLGRARQLLDASRTVFAQHAESDPTARLELAETDQLIARLPMHIALKPGEEDAAIEVALRHAESAEQGYAALDMVWEQARVWETIGRLRLKRGDVPAALKTLQATARRQQELGDALGLAATVEALAWALTAGGQHDDAIGLLRDSVALS
ncbi:MAG: tetratricopeptide (TPR) repeat protein, partial [Bradymonadia bacterium]